MADTIHPATVEDRRIDGEYGEVFHEGKYAADIVEIQGRIAIERREIPRAGQTSSVTRRGRVSREGTIRISKVDSRFESLIIKWANYTTKERREARAQGTELYRDTWLTIKLDDPDSWGSEELQLFGVKFWEIPIGFTQGDLIDRELPMTWEREQLNAGIPRPGNKGRWEKVNGVWTQVQWNKPPGEETWAGTDYDEQPI